MTPLEIARALGIRTLEEVAAAAGVSAESIRPAMGEPCLVLDYRGDEGARRWDRLAKPPISEVEIAPGLDPFTGLRAKRKRKAKRKASS
jgi:hypothetical protein